VTEGQKTEDKKEQPAKKKKGRKKQAPKPKWFVITNREALDQDEGGRCSITTEGSLAEDVDLFARANKLDLEDLIIYRLGPRVNLKLKAIIEDISEADNETEV
jgi:hypothetical protein